MQVIPSGATAAAAGNSYSIVVKHDGTVWTTGTSSNGEVSFFGGSTISSRFSVVTKIPGAKAVSAGSYHSMVLTQEGQIWTMGWNKYGQLGDGSTEDQSTFIAVIDSNAKAMSAGDIHSVVVKQDGSVWATGSNKYGQFGDENFKITKAFIKLVPFVYGAGFQSFSSVFSRIPFFAFRHTSCPLTCLVPMRSFHPHFTATMRSIVAFASNMNASDIMATATEDTSDGMYLRVIETYS